MVTATTTNLLGWVLGTAQSMAVAGLMAGLVLSSGRNCKADCRSVLAAFTAGQCTLVAAAPRLIPLALDG